MVGLERLSTEWAGRVTRATGGTEKGETGARHETGD